MRTQIILWAWWVSTCLSVLLTAHLLRSGLFRRYPWLTGMIAFQAGLSTVLLCVTGPFPKPHPYAEIWKAAQLPVAILDLAAALEGVFVLTRHLEHREFARKLLGFLAGFSLLVSLALCKIEKRGVDDLRSYIIMSEYMACIMLLLSLLSLVFIRHTGVVVRRNAGRNVIILSLFFACIFVGTFLRSASGGHASFAWSLITVFGQLACYLAWFTLSPSGEDLPEDREPKLDPEEFERRFSEHQAAAADLRKISSKALRSPFRETDT